MMKRLLAVAAGVLVSALSFAQGWQKPELTFETLKVSEVGGDTTIYYLYNVGADAFFTQGNSYGTQASLGTPALKVIFEKYVEEGSAWDGKTYLSNDEVRTLIDEMEQAGYALLLPAGEYIAISDDIFFRWSAADATGEKVEQVTPENNIGTPIVQSVWGDTNVNYLTYADLSDASTLIITVSSGNPRVLLNRTVDGGQVADGHLFETNGNATEYQTVLDNGDGTRTFIIDLAKICDEWGFVHLHAIKGANWADVVVTSILIGYRNGLPDAIETLTADMQPRSAVAGIYSITGAKQQSLQRGINIIRTADGKTAKVLVK